MLYDRSGGMNVLSAAATDPAIGVDLREGSALGLWIVNATIPADYQTAGKEPVEILVRTDLPGESVIRIPVRVWAKHNRPDPAWLERAKALIGRPAPMAVLNRLHGGQVEIGTEPGKVTAVVFSAHWCGHCSIHVPIIEKVAKDYMSRDVRFVGVAGSSGSDVAVEESVATWGVTWPVGVDYDRSVLTQYGVRAFPAVFLLDREGIVQAVHGRVANIEKNNGLDNLETELRGRTRSAPARPDAGGLPQGRGVTEAGGHDPAGGGTSGQCGGEGGRGPGGDVQAGRDGRVQRSGAECGDAAAEPAQTRGGRRGEDRPGDRQGSGPQRCVAMLRCEVVAPAENGPFSRQVTIETNDPRTPVVKVALSGTVSERRVAKPAEYLLGASALPRQVSRRDAVFGATACTGAMSERGCHSQRPRSCDQKCGFLPPLSERTTLKV